MTDHAASLAIARRACVVAPAGCGKTHLIASALRHCTGRQLVLTHTNAGTEVLRARLSQLGVPATRARVETVAAFALRFAAGYPTTSGVALPQPRTNDEWTSVYLGAARVLATRVGRTVLDASFTGVFVDEYQDCSLAQHALVLALATALPCRVLGDPLQAVFSFEKGGVIDWATHVEAAFDAFPVPSYPWRWEDKNPLLGAWLLDLRERIRSREPIDLRKAPAQFVKLDPRHAVRQRLDACFGAARKAGTVVAIDQWAAQCHQLAGQLSGTFTSIEPIEAEDLFASAVKLHAATGNQRALEVLAFAKLCATQVSSELASITTAFEKGRAAEARTKKHENVRQALLEVATRDDFAPVLRALQAAVRIPRAIIKRRDLFNAMVHAIREFDATRDANLEEAAWNVRHRTSMLGRTPYARIVSRTLLVKGLQYDHAIVLNAGSLSAEHLYVAMTRGARSLTVLSEEAVLRPWERAAGVSPSKRRGAPR